MKAQRWGRIVFTSSIAAYGAGLNGCRKSFFFIGTQVYEAANFTFLQIMQRQREAWAQ